MSDTLLVALIMGGATVLASVVAAVASIINVRVSRSNQEIAKDIRKNTDGMIKHLQSDATSNGVQAGIQAGIEIGKAEAKS